MIVSLSRDWKRPSEDPRHSQDDTSAAIMSETPENVEKHPDHEQLDQLVEKDGGYALDVDLLDADSPEAAALAQLKKAADGHTVLLPQPTDDPNDPLNWSPVKKHVILFIISCTAFLPDYGSATGAVTLLPQSK